MAIGWHSGTYHEGDHAAVCDICGIRFRRSQLRHNWKRQLVCGRCYDERNPQDYKITPKGDQQAVVGARPEPAPIFADPSIPPDPTVYPSLTGTGGNSWYSS